MRALQPVKGTHDILPDDMRRFRAVFETARQVAARYGYHEMATPIFEATEVFKRTLGDTSDVVTKEMYTFETKGGDLITLRPEATAGVARAFISGGLAQDLPLKFFVAGPMFRHERPQAGRQRQFHQIDIELLGVPQPEGDVEIIAAGAAILDALGVRDKATLELNTLGDPESRQSYRKALVEYFRDHEDKLSEDSRERLDRNPLRILDSKDRGDRVLVADAPLFGDYLNSESVDFFETVKAGLDALGIAYEVNPRLVRGLDYYTHTAFEFTTTALGAQGAILAGGRYDHLIAQLGGPPTAGTGWAAGVERLVLLMAGELPAPRPLAVVPIGAAAEQEALVLAEALRREGYGVELGFSGNMKKRMARANKAKARAALILGEDEMAQGAVTLRDLDTGEQELVPRDALSGRLGRFA